MPRERTIKGPPKPGTITEEKAFAVAKEILEERYGKQERHSEQGKHHTAGRVKKKSARSGKQQTSSTSNKRGNRT